MRLIAHGSPVCVLPASIYDWCCIETSSVLKKSSMNWNHPISVCCVKAVCICLGNSSWCWTGLCRYLYHVVNASIMPLWRYLSVPTVSIQRLRSLISFFHSWVVAVYLHVRKWILVLQKYLHLGHCWFNLWPRLLISSPTSNLLHMILEIKCCQCVLLSCFSTFKEFNSIWLMDLWSRNSFLCRYSSNFLWRILCCSVFAKWDETFISPMESICIPHIICVSSGGLRWVLAYPFTILFANASIWTFSLAQMSRFSVSTVSSWCRFMCLNVGDIRILWRIPIMLEIILTCFQFVLIAPTKDIHLLRVNFPLQAKVIVGVVPVLMDSTIVHVVSPNNPPVSLLYALWSSGLPGMTPPPLINCFPSSVQIIHSAAPSWSKCMNDPLLTPIHLPSLNCWSSSSISSDVSIVWLIHALCSGSLKNSVMLYFVSSASMLSSSKIIWCLPLCLIKICCISWLIVTLVTSVILVIFVEILSAHGEKSCLIPCRLTVCLYHCAPDWCNSRWLAWSKNQSHVDKNNWFSSMVHSLRSVVSLKSSVAHKLQRNNLSSMYVFWLAIWSH